MHKFIDMIIFTYFNINVNLNKIIKCYFKKKHPL